MNNIFSNETLLKLRALFLSIRNNFIIYKYIIIIPYKVQDKPEKKIVSEVVFDYLHITKN